jgi:hypothetical protein
MLDGWPRAIAQLVDEQSSLGLTLFRVWGSPRQHLRWVAYGLLWEQQ